MKFPVFDLHCDTAFAILNEEFNGSSPLRKNAYHIDLERAGELPGYAQCFACFTSDSETLPLKIAPEAVFTRELSGIIGEMRKNHDVIEQAFGVEDIQRNLAHGKMSGILTLEGTAGIGCNPDLLQELYSYGFRITSLGWNEKNPLTGSHITGGGLTAQGRRYVREAQRLGMIVDVSHISDEAFWDIMNITTAPVIASHSNSRPVWNVSRNLTDEMFTAICKSGGVAGINMCAEFLGQQPTLDTVCDHIIHFLELDPEGRHIALGCDLDGCDHLPAGFSGVEDYPKLAECMLRRNLSESTVYNIFWNNAMGVMKRCCM